MINWDGGELLLIRTIAVAVSIMLWLKVILIIFSFIAQWKEVFGTSCIAVLIYRYKMHKSATSTFVTDIFPSFEQPLRVIFRVLEKM